MNLQTEAANNASDDSMDPAANARDNSLLIRAQETDEGLLPPELLQYWHAILRWRWVLAGIVGASLVIGLIVTLLMPPLYTARAQIEISREQKNVTNVEDVDAISGNGDMEFYDTQYSLLKAESLADRVTTALRLQEDKAFFEAHGTSPSERIEARKLQAARLLLKNISIEPVRKSKLVDVKYTSRSRSLSARVANAWVREFIGASMDRQFSSNADARAFLEKRLATLRQRLDESERDVITYASDKGIVELGTTRDADGKTQAPRTLASVNLEGLNQALIEARAERIAAESRVGTGGLENSPDAMTNATISGFRQRRGEVASEYARLLSKFEPGYPEVRALRDQMDALDASIARETARVGLSRRQAYNEAVKRERNLEAQVNQLKAQLDRQQRNTIQYTVFVREADTNRQLYDALLQRYKEIGIAGSVGASNISIVDQAKEPGSPSAPSLPYNLAVALLAGIGVAFLALLGLEQINEGIRAPADVWDRLGLPLLGNVPLVEEEPLIALEDPKSYLSEAYFSIRSALAVATTHGLPRNLAVVSTLPSEGKSTSSLALAAVIGRTGKSVLLVDADLRSPSVHRLLGITNKVGFSNMLAGENDIAQFVQDTKYTGLHVLPSGPLPPSPSELLSSDRLSEVLSLLQSHYDHVIFDAPPVLGLADAPLLGQAVEGLIYVIEPGLAPIRGIRSSLQRLRMLGGNIFGAVVTKIDPTRQHYGYSYGYGYGHGYGAYGYGKDVKDADVTG